MRVWLCIAFLLWPGLSLAQTREVRPSELSLEVVVEPTAQTPLAREMVLITIKGVYRRHITREQLIQPDLAGFNWTQLGDDRWRDERLDGEKVKTFSRRMAIFADQPGEITIGAFTHSLTLTDEGDAWFEHKVTSAPVTITVAPAPTDDPWWFPLKSLKISDQWSNAPDQLVPGEGVLRVVRIEALGVTPEMIPPMPMLNSPSAMIFPHPEQRFVELSPQGPLSYAFWRWTIRPGNDTSTIVEPLSFDYFDTVNRVSRTVTISAQRVAYGAVVPDSPVDATAVQEARLPGWPVFLLGALIFGGGLFYALTGWQVKGLDALRRFAMFDPLARDMWRAARAGDLRQMRRAADAILTRDGASHRRTEQLLCLDRAIFGRDGAPVSPRDFTKQYLRANTSKDAL